MPSFQCPKCELLFAAQGELDWHMREDHRADEKRTLQPTIPEQSGHAGGDIQATATGNGGRDKTRRARWWPPWRRSA
jgi:hypothetical protein